MASKYVSGRPLVGHSNQVTLKWPFRCNWVSKRTGLHGRTGWVSPGTSSSYACYLAT